MSGSTEGCDAGKLSASGRPCLREHGLVRGIIIMNGLRKDLSCRGTSGTSEEVYHYG